MAIWDRLISTQEKDDKRAKELWDRALKYFDGKLYNRALKDLQDAIQLNPGLQKEAVELMQAFSGQGSEEQALSVGFALLKLDPQNVELMNKLANVLRKMGSYSKAVKLYTYVLKANPQMTEAKYNLAACSFRIATADGELVSQTHKAEAYTQFRRYEFQGRRGGFLPVPNQTLDESRASKSAKGAKGKEAEAPEEELSEEAKAQQMERMIQELKGDVDAEPGNWECEFNLALLYDLNQFGELAIQHYRAALEIDPEQRLPPNNLAVALMLHKSEFQEAEGLLLKNLERHRFDRTTVLNLGLLYRQQKKAFQTLKFFVYLGDLLSKSLWDFETAKVEAHAQEIFERRKYIEAIPVFENLAYEKQVPFWLEKLAVMYFNQKNEEKYVHALKRLLKINPDHEEAHTKLAEAAANYETEAHQRLEKGSRSMAIQMLLKAVQIEEKPERWVELAEWYEEEGEEILAGNALKRWKQLTGGDLGPAEAPPATQQTA
ncbi:MAG: tetratricopeptide repeat protein [Candidatus Lambdaproteobacteria bacterium]|nr:tetratricopeptide repeat protein [Candidatus Lambdaproteobacteria bacterium]